MKRIIWPCVITGIALLVILAAGTLAFVYSGAYDIGADRPHSRPVYALMQTLRWRAIERHARDVVVPPLDDPQRVLEGAGHYADMCTGCHLAPGLRESEIRPGLYPQPPDLSRVRVDPKQAFLVIKHGIKMSAMPAWGASHGDDTIWNLVAFLRKLPDMSPQQYRDLVAKAPPDEDMGMGADHGHQHGAAEDHGHDAMPPVHDEGIRTGTPGQPGKPSSTH